jgi:hypothetical protein
MKSCLTIFAVFLTLAIGTLMFSASYTIAADSRPNNPAEKTANTESQPNQASNSAPAKENANDPATGDTAHKSTKQSVPPLYPPLTINIALGLIVLAYLAMLVAAFVLNRSTWIQSLKPTVFFVLEIFYLLSLISIAIIYSWNIWGMRDACPEFVGAVIPIGVPWFGALGAVFISLRAVFYQNTVLDTPQKDRTEKDDENNWNPKYNFWHIARPLMGASMGTIAFLMFILLETVALMPGKSDVNFDQLKHINPIVSYILAFIVGYREEYFANLIKKVADLIFKTPDDKPAAG